MKEIDLKIQATVRKVQVQDGENVLDVIKREQILIQAPCNGRGTCGKCRIQVEGETSERLACQTEPVDGMIIEILAAGDQIQAVSDYIGQQESGMKSVQESEPSYVAAVDLGTTTVVIQLGCVDSGAGTYQELQTVRSLNPQSVYGADVISRITAASQGDSLALKDCITSLISSSLEAMCENQGIPLEELQEIVVGGNTTMLHLLRGYDVSGLGSHPFQPVTLKLERIPYHELNPDWKDQTGPDVILLPGISAFVGSDITAGLYALGMEKEEDICLLVDLGTNGEIVLGNRKRLFATSTAAGPAFEGGNLSCGVGSIPGAVNEVILKKRYAAVKTIDNRPAIGLCGTGALELLAELWSNGWIDAHGSFVKEEQRQNGYKLELRGPNLERPIIMTQEDVRQLQLAKGAIRAGIEVLIEEYGASYEDIRHVYLAGGMGFGLNVWKAGVIGLIPHQLQAKVEIVGNSCLGGCIRYLKNGSSKAQAQMEEMITKVKPVQLAKAARFAQKYLKYMEFESIPASDLVDK